MCGGFFCEVVEEHVLWEIFGYWGTSLQPLRLAFVAFIVARTGLFEHCEICHVCVISFVCLGGWPARHGTSIRWARLLA